MGRWSVYSPFILDSKSSQEKSNQIYQVSKLRVSGNKLGSTLSIATLLSAIADNIRLALKILKQLRRGKAYGTINLTLS